MGHTLNLAGQIAGRGVTANVLHPGGDVTLIWAHVHDQNPERNSSKFLAWFFQQHLYGPLFQSEDRAMVIRDLVFGDLIGEIVSVKAPVEPQ